MIMDERYYALLEKLWHCALSCEKCATAGLGSGHAGSLVSSIRLSQDCADICFQLVRAIKRRSELVAPLLQVCAYICQLCAEACGNHSEDACQQCAAACMHCSEACGELTEVKFKTT